jgi:hypothetical protein
MDQIVVTKRQKLEYDGIQSPSVLNLSEMKPYIPSSKFAGARVGYAFKLGPEGQGYYIDDVQLNRSIKMEKIDVDESINHEENMSEIVEKEEPRRVSPSRRKSTESTDMDVNVEAVLETLSKHLLNDKKFLKSCDLLVKLINHKLTQQNAEFFYNCIATLMTSCPERNVTNEIFSKGYKQIFNALNPKFDAFDEKTRYRLITFSLYAWTRCDMLTDDSFQFAKSCRIVRDSFSELSNYVEDMDLNDDKVERLRVLIATLETAIESYKWSWAKPPIESLIKLASERRTCFPPSMRDEVDEITSAVTLAMRKNVSLNNVLSRSIRSYNSTAHPLRNKSIEILK